VQPTSSTTCPVAVARYSTRTRDPELAYQLISDTYGVLRPQISGSRERFRFSLTSVAVGSIASDGLTHSMNTRASIEPLRHLTATYVARGRIAVRVGREVEHLGPGDRGLYPYGTGFEVHWSPVEQCVLRVDFDTIARHAAQTTDTDAAALRFLGVRPLSPGMGRYWGTVMTFVRRELAAERPAIGHPLVLAQTEALLAAAALAVFPNTTLTAAPAPGVGQVGPATLRRALAYIDAHAGEPITVADIAAGAGVGARALQYAFAGHQGTTPMGYLTRVRLERAHRDLQAADPELDTVGQIALRWGFAKRSRFAAAYRHTYGVNPSHTLHA
jgi:AraC-like DNA-binding protein